MSEQIPTLVYSTQSSQSSDSHPVNPQKNVTNLKLRPKIYKIKRELDEYYLLCMDHREILTIFYDYYMESSPMFIKKSFCVLFPANRLAKQILIYCLFYHSIWWTQNSLSNKLAINYHNINFIIFFIIFYYNFYQLIVQHFFIRTVCFNLLKFFQIASTQKLKNILNVVECFIYFILNLKIFHSLKFEHNFSNNFICFLMVPHFYFLLYNNFDINFTLFNFSVFTNLIEKSSKAQNIKKDNSHFVKADSDLDALSSISLLKNTLNSPKSTKANTVKNLVYSDCSNMSVETFLNGKLSLPNVSLNSFIPSNTVTISTNNSSNNNNNNNNINTQSNQTIKIIRQSINRTKQAKNKILNWYIAIFNLPNNLINASKQHLINLSSKFYNIYSAGLNSLKASKLVIRKRNAFSVVNFSNKFCTLHHRCHTDATHIREETEYFKSEYNYRLKEILNHTFESVYFNFLIARICVPASLNIRNMEYLIYFTSALLSTFISYWLYCLPLSFIVSFNRNTEHLGSWRLSDHTKKLVNGSKSKASIQTSISTSNIESSTNDVNKWINSRIYYQGDKVMYMGNIYVCDTVYCASIPGNKDLDNVFRYFSNPFRITFILFFLEISNLLLLLIYFLMNRRWYAIITFIVETLCNCHLFFILSRDFFLLKKEKNVNLKKDN